MERAKRLEDLAVLVVIALGERDMAVAAAEQRAGCALREMTAVEGVTLREAVEWCGDKVGIREATRLCRRQIEDEQDDDATCILTTAETGVGDAGTAWASTAAAG